MGKKKQDPQPKTPATPLDSIPSAAIPPGTIPPAPRKRAGMQVDTLEPRILLSGTWVEVEAMAEVAEAEMSAEESPVWMEEKGGVYGTDENDWLKGSEGDDVLYGGDGNDRFVYREGDGVDRNIRKAGEDQIDATRARTLVLDEIHEKYSIEYIVGSEEGLTIEGTKGNDYLDFSTVTLKNLSQIDGGAGDDVIIGSA